MKRTPQENHWNTMGEQRKLKRNANKKEHQRETIEHQREIRGKHNENQRDAKEKQRNIKGTPQGTQRKTLVTHASKGKPMEKLKGNHVEKKNKGN